MTTAALETIRAKSGIGGRPGESLVFHTRQVVERLASLRRVLPGLADVTGEPRLWRWALWACLLHDVGKSAAGFQAQLNPGGSRWGHRHEVLSLAFLDCLCMDEEEASWVAAGVASHHRDYAEIRRLYPDTDEGDDDPLPLLLGSIDPVVVEGLVAWLSQEHASLSAAWGFANERPPTHPRGLPDDVSDWGPTRVRSALRAYGALIQRLHSERPSSPANRVATALRGLVLMADHTASAHERLGELPRLDPARLAARLNLAWEALYPHQRAAAGCAGNVLLEAPTGSGKTEAALLWTATQTAAGNVGRLFYLLPYQASLNAMHGRLEGIYGRGMVALQHARALQALYRRLLDRSYPPEGAERTHGERRLSPGSIARPSESSHPISS